MTWQQEYLQLIDDCEARESRLSDWERSFISSIRSQVEGGATLSPKQIEKLDSVWEKATSRG